MSLKNIGEFGLIGEIRDAFRDGEHGSEPESGNGIDSNPATMGIGDDCAVIPQRDGIATLVSTDMLVEGSHFLLDDISPYRLGWKSAAVNISDIAAMGGTPTATFLALAIPDKIDNSWMKEFIRGYRDLSLKFSCPLLGGDTTSSPGGLCICVTVLGECPQGRQRCRDMAREGDLVCVTGNLGDSAAGLRIILEKKKRDTDAEHLIGKHYLPVPQVEAGRKLAATPGVHAMMDISDGIGSDIRHILEASHKGAEIDVNALPLSGELKRVCASHGWDPVELATCGGEDYELLFTITPEAQAGLDVEHHIIGRITSGENLEWVGSDRDYLGFRHF